MTMTTKKLSIDAKLTRVTAVSTSAVPVRWGSTSLTHRFAILTAAVRTHCAQNAEYAPVLVQSRRVPSFSFFQLPGYSRVLPVPQMLVTGMSST